ncbi:hypothetical protein FPV67DRAFT_1457574 [Lyophyllum atratum]|nr:hypothetical protein FPV67DRAFT_1457574 [Lyophyllum atratum]
MRLLLSTVSILALMVASSFASALPDVKAATCLASSTSCTSAAQCCTRACDYYLLPSIHYTCIEQGGQLLSDTVLARVTWDKEERCRAKLKEEFCLLLRHHFEASFVSIGAMND